MTTVVQENLKCPVCNYAADSATSVNTDSIPKNGDISLCINCSSLNEFVIGDCVSLIPVSEKTIDDLKRNAPGIYSHVMKIADVIRKKHAKA